MSVILRDYLRNYYDQSYPPGGEVVMPASRSLPDDVEHFTIAQIQAWVDAHEAQAPTVLDRELAGRARVTLVDWLRGFIEAENNPDPSAN